MYLRAWMGVAFWYSNSALTIAPETSHVFQSAAYVAISAADLFG